MSQLIEALQVRANAIGSLGGRGELMSQEQYVLDQGVKMISSSPLSEEQYAYLKVITGSIQCLPKQCFYNAQVMTLIDDYTFTDTPRVKYYEGYVWTGLMPILHGWITLDDKIVDVTLSKDREGSAQRFINGEPPQEDLMDRVLGEIPQGWEYLGVPMDNDYVVGFMLEKKESRSLIDNWQDGWPLLKK
jgi:hypothetical protein